MPTRKLQSIAPVGRKRLSRKNRLLRAHVPRHHVYDGSTNVAIAGEPTTVTAHAIPLPMTKLNTPHPPIRLLTCDQLLRQLSEAIQQALTRVVTLAGYGKATLLSTWAQQASMPVACDAPNVDDSPPQLFCAYVIAVLDSAQPGVGVHAQSLLDTAATTPDQVLTALINRLATAQPMTLVPDDYHLIHAEQTHQVPPPNERGMPPSQDTDEGIQSDYLFTKRELEVLRLLADGCTNREIAQKLIVGANTVKMHLQHLYNKLGAHNRVQAVKSAHDHGLV